MGVEMGKEQSDDRGWQYKVDCMRKLGEREGPALVPIPILLGRQ